MSDSPVTVITVSFNSAIPLKAMLPTISKSYPVIVVDNGSEDKSAEVAESFGAKVILNEQNIGFSRACNKGAAAANTEYLFFLNPDTELEPNTIEELYQATKRYTKASAFAPVIKSQSGTPTIKFRSVLVPKEQWLPRELPNTDFEAPAISGAAVFVSKRIFDEVGKFDENIFFYYEDDDLSFRLRKQIGPIIVVHSAQLMHLGGQSSPANSRLTGIKHYHGQRAKMYVVRKHGFPRSLIRRIFEFSLKLVVSCLFFQRKHKRYFYCLIGILSALKDGGKYRGPIN